MSSSNNPRDEIQNMFDESNRFGAFGEVLMRMHVQGFRCHTNTIIEISSPITAFCGLNGTGKSTLLQLAAAAYKNPQEDIKPYYIKDFLVVGTLDPQPFRDDAAIEYGFWRNNRTLRPLTLSRNSNTRRWQGYGRRTPKPVLFAGIGLYLPKIEQRDFIVRNANQLTISNSSIVSERIKNWTCKILGCQYDVIQKNEVSYSHRTGNVLQVERSEQTYSEAHMGYGEGRSQHLISILETLPNRSLVLIEEPETSLHPSAQFQFGKYLIDVVKEKRHQIFLTTHSEYLLESLHSKSRIYLYRNDHTIDAWPGLTSAQAKSLMTDGVHKALNILVEDKCAKAILTEIIGRVDPNFLRSVGIYPGGDKDTIAKAVRTISNTNLVIAAVRDGDKEPSPSENIFKLPGTLPPEKEIFQNASVKAHVQRRYQVNLSDFSAAYLADVNHHYWLQKLSEHLGRDESALTWELAGTYALSLPESEIGYLIPQLKEASTY